MIRPVLETFRQPEFAAGFKPAVAFLVVGGAFALASRRWWRRSPPPVAGPLVAGATVVGLHDVGLLPAGLAVGLAGLAAGGLVIDLFRLPSPLVALAALPGAWWIAIRCNLVAVVWIRCLVIVVIVVGAVLVCDFDAHWRGRGAAPVLLALSAFGVYATVPDTDRVLVILAACLVLGLLGWPWPIASLGPSGACVTVGLLTWGAAAGGFGRPSSILGGVGSLGLLVAEPVGRALTRGHSHRADALRRRWWAIFALAGAQLLLVVFNSRVAGLRTAVAPAAVLVSAALTVAVVAVACIRGDREADRRDGRRRRLISGRGSSEVSAS